MRRIKDSRENETEKNVRDAFENFSRGKHHRAAIKEYEADLDENVRVVLACRLTMSHDYPRVGG